MRNGGMNASFLFFAIIGLRCMIGCCFVIVTREISRRRWSAGLHSSPVPVDLDTLTVKDLRQLLKDSHVLERGALSKLKRKQDIIDYLQNNISKMQLSVAPNCTSTPTTESSVFIEKPGRLGKMPQIKTPSKDDMFEYLYEQYPPLREANGTNLVALGEDDVRQLHHPMLQDASYSDMDIITVGTASCSPGITRGVSCTALRLHWQKRYLPSSGGTNVEQTSFQRGTWLFDVGECTQLQAQRTNRVRPGKISKIFLTHAHGDHTFGLPGLMCLMGQDRDRDSPPLDIYGPEGLRMWLRVAIRYSISRIIPPYRVHEIMNIPMAPEWRYARLSQRYYNSLSADPKVGWTNQGLAGEDPESWISQANRMPLQASIKFGEMDGGRNIYPIENHPLSSDGAPVWEVEDEDDVKVFAAPMSHGVPCLGYVVEEQDRPGRLRNEYVEPIVRRNIEALKARGFHTPMRAMAIIKNLPEGSSFTFPDGTIVSQDDAVEPPRAGRKVVICGDTSDARALTNLAMNADVVVHEATNSYLDFLDRFMADLKSVTRDSMTHGHSTPQMAAKFARRVNAKRLILNHFSPRYKGDQAIESISIMTRIERQAMQAGGYNNTQVATAWDFMLLPIPRNE